MCNHRNTGWILPNDRRVNRSVILARFLWCIVNICIYKTKTTYAYKALASMISYWRQEFVLFIIVSIAINVRPFVVKKLYDRTEVSRVSFNMRYSLSYLFTSRFCLRVKNLSLTYKFHLLSVSCSMRFGTEYNSYSMQHV